MHFHDVVFPETHIQELEASYITNNMVCIYKHMSSIYTVYINIKKLHGLSPRANYTDRATTACRRSDWQTFADKECHVVSVTNPYRHILGFLDRSRYFSIK
jgi:hypothetical protein